MVGLLFSHDHFRQHYSNYLRLQIVNQQKAFRKLKDI